MKKLLNYIFPLFFGLFAFLFYIVIYHPAVESEDFTTAVLVFFTALGSSAIVRFSAKEFRFLLRLYAVSSVILPLFFIFFIKIFKVNFPFHPLLLGLIILGLIVLRFFVAYNETRR